MDIFYASCWYNFYVFTIVPRDFYDSARDFYSAPTAPIRYPPTLLSEKWLAEIHIYRYLCVKGAR